VHLGDGTAARAAVGSVRSCFNRRLADAEPASVRQVAIVPTCEGWTVASV
jgi:hypothetical protein